MTYNRNKIINKKPKNNETQQNIKLNSPFFFISVLNSHLQFSSNLN